jgi:integrator complex subunit 1
VPCEDQSNNRAERLAYPGMWWRVTVLALIMCGVSPEHIGAPVWEEHPTLRAMIKMIISSRYRFPTVDCNDADRAEMKKSEQVMREEVCIQSWVLCKRSCSKALKLTTESLSLFQEAKIAEILFLPPKAKAKTEPELDQPNGGRNRISARQQQKRERAQKKRLEKEAAEALAEENKRKKMLRAAQKTIILWDPTGAARKPPREAAELLVSVESHFSLSKIFQRHVEPDFLLMTIGKATRGAIERAYDWLIPIISDIPETIARLHASASCVLLLKAYGTEGDEKAQLKELSAPLLRHVSDSITGKFGQADSVRAFDLLMSDVASHNADRRRCARRVLYDSIGKLRAPQTEETDKKLSWMLNILKLEHAKGLVGDAIKHMVRKEETN